MHGATLPTMQEIGSDLPDLQRHGIIVLVWGDAPDGLPDMTLAVADAVSIQFLCDRYGRTHLSGWLQPV